MIAPESPKHFDPNRPQNLQPVVNYIERQDGNIKKLVHSIENNENLHRFDTPLRSELEYVGFPSSYEENPNIQNEKVSINYTDKSSLWNLIIFYSWVHFLWITSK